MTCDQLHHNHLLKMHISRPHPRWTYQDSKFQESAFFYVDVTDAFQGTSTLRITVPLVGFTFKSSQEQVAQTGLQGASGLLSLSSC